MERYTLSELYANRLLFNTQLNTALLDKSSMIMGIDLSQSSELISFISSAIYGYFYDDLVAYTGDNIAGDFINRLSYDVAVKLPYWKKKYAQIKTLLTTDDLSLLQTSKVTSSSTDNTNSASGTLQKTATTPTGVSAGGDSDSFEIGIDKGEDSDTSEVITNGFADKYTNAQQKFANASKIEGSRSGNITREGSIDELLNVLEKLPSSFANEITKALQKHFIFDYDGEMKGVYDETD